MRYELYLRSPVENKAWPKQDILQVLEATGFAVDSGLPARLDNVDLRVEKFKRDDALDSEDWQGLNFSFPLGVNENEASQAIDCVFSASEALHGQVFDVQIGQMVTRKQHDQISASWRRSYEFHSGIAGTTGLGSGAPVLKTADEDDGWLNKYKPMLIGGLIILVGILIFRSCFSNWLDKALVAPAPIRNSSKGH